MQWSHAYSKDIPSRPNTWAIRLDRAWGVGSRAVRCWVDGQLADARACGWPVFAYLIRRGSVSPTPGRIRRHVQGQGLGWLELDGCG